MKYCSNCGQQIDDNAIFCSNCGARTNGDATGAGGFGGGYGGGYGGYGGFGGFGGYNPYGGAYPVYDTRESTGVAVISFLFWQVGLVLWFLLRRTRPGKARSAAKGTCASASMSMPVLGLVLWLVWKGDPTKHDYAKIAGIFAIVGVVLYALVLVLSAVLGVDIESTEEAAEGAMMFINTIIR